MEEQNEPTNDRENETGSKVASFLRGQPAWLLWLVAGCLVVSVAVAGFVWFGDMRADDSLTAVQKSAIEEGERAVRRDPKDARARLALAYAYRQVGRYEECIAQCSEILDDEPQNTSALYNRAIASLAIGRRTPAEDDLWRVLEIQPDHVQAAVALGNYYASRDQYRSLLVAVRPVAEKRPEVAMLQYLMGLSYEHTDHSDWAIARYRMALRRNPNMAEARAGLERLDATP